MSWLLKQRKRQEKQTEIATDRKQKTMSNSITQMMIHFAAEQSYLQAENDPRLLILYVATTEQVGR